MYMAPSTVADFPVVSSACATLSLIASAAFSVKVNATIEFGSAPWSSSHATR